MINHYRIGRVGKFKLLMCLECNPPEPKAILTKTHMRIYHNMTKEEYCKTHPEHSHAVCWGDLNPDRAEYKWWRKEAKKRGTNIQKSHAPAPECP